MHGGNKRICSARSEFTWADVNGTNSYDWHEFQSSLTPSGDRGPDYWWDLIYTMNTEYDSPSDINVWNAFLHMGQHMYVRTCTWRPNVALQRRRPSFKASCRRLCFCVYRPTPHPPPHPAHPRRYVNDLTAHVVSLESKGTPYLARTYTSQAYGDDGRTMYVVFIPNPYNGNVVIIHSGSVGDWHARKFFRDLEAEACVQAVSLPYPLSSLERWWDKVYIETVDPTSLPKPYPVMDTHPVHDLDAVSDYFENKIKIREWADVDLVAWSNNATDVDLPNGQFACSTYSIQMASQFQTDYEVKYIYTPEAKGFDEVGRFQKYTDDEVRKSVGFNTGYNRWMDNHIALALPKNLSPGSDKITTLDEMRPYLEDAETPYHIHFTEVTGGEDMGSIWAWGPGGLGVEYHALITYESFEYPVGNFDFCTADSVCQDADVICNFFTETTLPGATLLGEVH